MSCNRENVIWRRRDGTYSRGFFTVIYPTVYDEDFDYEWDVDYDFSRFEWFRTGFRTVDEALRAWDGANPGGYELRDYREPGDRERIAEFEEMAKRFRGGRR